MESVENTLFKRRLEVAIRKVSDFSELAELAIEGWENSARLVSHLQARNAGYQEVAQELVKKFNGATGCSVCGGISNSHREDCWVGRLERLNKGQ